MRLPSLLKNRAVLLASALLLAQAGLFRLASGGIREAVVAPLISLPDQTESWRAISGGSLDQRSSRILQPDDFLLRTYEHIPSGAELELFVAYFRAQTTGRSPHSPRNCLPGSGWVANEGGRVSIPAGDGRGSWLVNRYVVAKADQKAVVLYWYQSAGGVVASEYLAKFQLFLDAIRYQRTDTALVRLVVPFSAAGQPQADRLAAEFARWIEPEVDRVLHP
jgi:EpsI family protein